MKKFLNKKILIMILVVMSIFNIIVPTYSYGLDVGGILLKPISSVVGAALDAVNILMNFFLSTEGSKQDLSNFTDLENAMFASPEKIFSNSYTMLNANLFSVQDTSVSVGGTDFGETTIIKIKKGVAGIYYLLRNVGAIVLLCLLIYTGIRIVLSARMPEEQSKWKMYLFDWLKALALLIFIHLIMSGIFSITDLLAKSLADLLGNGSSMTGIIRSGLMNSWDSTPIMIYCIMYAYTTYLTVVFAFSYFKRVVWTAVLIVIAPIVSVLYAVGGQGKDTYKKWFREFLINCLIQPFHIVIYYVLIMLPLQVADKANNDFFNAANISTLSYALIAISLIRPAEKFIRGLFGMNGQIASTASYDSGKQVLDSISNAIKQTVMTAATVATAVATGGASLAATAVGKGAALSKGAAAGAGAANGGPGIPMANGNPIGDIANAAGLPNTLGEKEVAEGISEVNGNRRVSAETLKNIGNGTDLANEQQNAENDALNTSLYNRLSKNEDSRLGRFLNNPKAMMDALEVYDKSIDPLKHMIGDVGRAFGSFEGGPGHPPVRMAPFYRDRIRARMEDEEKAFASSGVVQNYFYETHKEEYREKYVERFTTKHYDDKGKLVRVDIDEEALKEAMKNAAKADAEKASQYVKYGFTDVEQIDSMMKNAKGEGYTRPDDVINYMAKYNAVQNAMIREGVKINGIEVTADNINTDAITQAIKDNVKYAAIDRSGVAHNVSASNELVKLEKEIKDNGIKLSYDTPGDVKIIYNLIEHGRNSGQRDISNITGGDKLPTDIKNFINSKMADNNTDNSNS